MKKYAVIVAGGTGVRMGSPVPKQFISLGGKSVLWYTLKAFLAAFEDISIILVVPGKPDHGETIGELIASVDAGGRVQVVGGGATRFQSVRNGLALVGEDSVVFVHDGVRCLVSVALIHRCYDMALRKGSAIPVVESRDSVRMLTEKGSMAVDRRKVMLVQTPQTFLSRILLPSYDVEYSEGFTDEATVVEAAGHPISLVEGEANNIKITLPADLLLAEKLLRGG